MQIRLAGTLTLSINGKMLIRSIWGGDGGGLPFLMKRFTFCMNKWFFLLGVFLLSWTTVIILIEEFIYAYEKKIFFWVILVIILRLLLFLCVLCYFFLWKMREQFLQKIFEVFFYWILVESENFLILLYGQAKVNSLRKILW